MPRPKSQKGAVTATGPATPISEERGPSMRDLGQAALEKMGTGTERNAEDAAEGEALGNVPGSSGVEDDSRLALEDDDLQLDQFDDQDPVGQGQQAPAAGGQGTQQQPAGPSRALIEAFEAQGYGFGEGYDDEQFINEMAEREALIARQEEELAFYRSQQGSTQSAPAHGAAPGGASPAPAAPAQFKLDVPEWDPAMEQFLTTDDSGNIVAKPGADPTLPTKYRKFKIWESQQLSAIARNPALAQLAQNPEAFLAQVVTPLAEKIAAQKVEALAGTYQKQQEDYYVGQIRSQPGYVSTDANGRVMRNPRTQAPVPTPEGVAFEREMANLLKTVPGMTRTQAADIAFRLHPPRKAQETPRQEQSRGNGGRQGGGKTIAERLGGGAAHQPRRQPADQIPRDSRGLPSLKDLGHRWLAQKAGQ